MCEFLPFVVLLPPFFLAKLLVTVAACVCGTSYYGITVPMKLATGNRQSVNAETIAIILLKKPTKEAPGKS